MPAAARPWPGHIFTYTADGRWTNAAPSIHFGICDYTGQDSVGPDMAFARKLIENGISRRIGFIPTAVSFGIADCLSLEDASMPRFPASGFLGTSYMVSWRAAVPLLVCSVVAQRYTENGSPMAQGSSTRRWCSRHTQRCGSCPRLS